MSDSKKQTLDNALKQIESQFGKGTIMKLGTRETVEVPSIGTGSFGLDKALGIGGLPKGRVVEIYGPESSGKTTLTLQIIAECQKAGGSAAFIDAEHALDPQVCCLSTQDTPPPAVIRNRGDKTLSTQKA